MEVAWRYTKEEIAEWRAQQETLTPPALLSTATQPADAGQLLQREACTLHARLRPRAPLRPAGQRGASRRLQTLRRGAVRGAVFGTGLYGSLEKALL